MGLGRLFGLALADSLIAINLQQVVLQDPLSLALDIIELTAVQRPAEDADDQQNQQRRHRDQEVEDVHVKFGLGQRARRKELKITSNELLAMPSPAAQGGSQPITASGMQAPL